MGTIKTLPAFERTIASEQPPLQPQRILEPQQQTQPSRRRARQSRPLQKLALPPAKRAQPLPLPQVRIHRQTRREREREGGERGRKERGEDPHDSQSVYLRRGYIALPAATLASGASFR